MFPLLLGLNYPKNYPRCCNDGSRIDVYQIKREEVMFLASSI